MLARGVFGGKNSKLIRGATRAAGDSDVIISVFFRFQWANVGCGLGRLNWGRGLCIL
jgi:hypothetical protein